jgi:hypothetical protein
MTGLEMVLAVVVMTGGGALVLAVCLAITDAEIRWKDQDHE